MTKFRNDYIFALFLIALLNLFDAIQYDSIGYAHCMRTLMPSQTSIVLVTNLHATAGTVSGQQPWARLAMAWHNLYRCISYSRIGGA